MGACVPKVLVLRVLGVPAVQRVLLASLILTLTSCTTRELAVATIQTAGPAVLIATIEATCDRCAWDVEGREAVMLRVLLDGRYSSHVPLVRTGKAEYNVLVGSVDAGAHTVAVEADRDNSARDLRTADAATARITRLQFSQAGTGSYLALAHAPFIYERANASGRFTDIPVFMWFEQEETESAARRFRYSVVFTNEDGGTPTDRLMATWGRTTDIEYVYSVLLDSNGAIQGEDIQGPEHKVLLFDGKREGRHPLLWVSTDNNMVLSTGTTTIRYAPAPMRFDLHGRSRETVMDANPWLYTLAAQELRREGKIVAEDTAGSGTIPDPRRFLTLEACGQLNEAALAFAIKVDGQWIESDRGRDYRIVRDGCFRAAIPMPPSRTARDVTGLRAQAYVRKTEASAPKPVGPVRLTGVSAFFELDEQYRPKPSSFMMAPPLNPIVLQPGGPPVEIPFKLAGLPTQ